MAEKLLNWLLRLLAGSWIPLVLIATLVSLVGYSLDQANWVRGGQVFLSVFIFSIGFGWLLARSRFPGWFALPYALLIAVLAAVEAAGRILPEPDKVFDEPFLSLVEDLNLKLFTFLLRAAGWRASLAAGEDVEDTGLFILLLSLVLALVGMWLAWTLVRQRRALNGLVPLGLLFAINIHLSRQPLSTYFVFLLTAILLAAYSAYSRQQADWQRRRVDFPEQLGLEWGGAAFALALVIVLLARAAPFVGTAEGWRTVTDLVDRWTRQPSEAAERIFSGVDAPPPPVDAWRVVQVSTPNLAEIGEPIAQGPETVMWVRTSDPPPVPLEIGARLPVSAATIHYWRSSIYGAYTGRGWQPAPPSPEIHRQDDDPPTAPPGRYLLRQDFEIVAEHDGALFSVNDPLQTSTQVRIRATRLGDGALVEGEVMEYQVLSAATRVSANALAAAPRDYPADIRREYLQLPADLPPRVRALAERVAGGEADPYQQALRIQNYLRENFEYSLAVGMAPAGRDVVDHFLFNEKAGFCSQYASAMTVMLRTLGVPARVVAGYAMGEYDSSRQAYRVPVSASHAWVEVFFPGIGWVEFEPTAAREAIVYPDEAAPSRAAGEVAPIDRAQPGDRTGLMLALAVTAAVVLLGLPFLLLRLFAASRSAPPVQVDVLYRRMRTALAWAGLPGVASATPDEYLAQHAGRLAAYNQLSQALTQATALYRETAFGPRSPDPHRVRVAGQLWRQSLWEWVTLWLRSRWQQLRRPER